MAGDHRRAAVLHGRAAGWAEWAIRDPAAAGAALAGQRDLLEAELRRHGTRSLAWGEGSLHAEFAASLDAARGALAAQRAVAAHNAGLPPDERIRWRWGLHRGALTGREGAWSGDAAGIAEALADRADPGSICVSPEVRSEVETRLQAAFAELDGDPGAHRMADRHGARGAGPVAPETSPAKRALAALALALLAAAAAATAWLVLRG